MRIIKSATGVLLCYLIQYLRGGQGIVFYSQLAVLWCMQDYVSETRAKAKQRTQGTVIGATFGLILTLIHQQIGKFTLSYDDYLYALLVSLFIIAIIYTTVVLEKRQTSYFSCVVFLSIAVNHVGDENPYLFVFNRVLDTMIGILLGVIVNSFSLPREKNTDILFVSGLDETLLADNDNMSAYSRVELNRIIKSGAKFTVSTIRTPASLIDPLRDIDLNLPLIVMDGAALFDIKQKQYIHEYVISAECSQRVINTLDELKMSFFTNVIIDDMVVIYYDQSENKIYNTLREKLRSSPYRNYVRGRVADNQPVVYFMIIDTLYNIDKIYEVLAKQNYAEHLRMNKYPSDRYTGYWYLKIYNHNATKENMMGYLRQLVDVEKVVTFGTIEDKYTHVIEAGDSNKVVKLIKKEFEPIKAFGKKRGK